MWKLKNNHIRFFTCLMILVSPMICAFWTGLALQVPILFSLTPRWTVTANAQLHDNCQSAAEAQQFNTQPVADQSMTTISPAGAQQIADLVIAKQRGWMAGFQDFYASAPNLVLLTLSDGQERLVWHRVLVVKGSETLQGMADIVYVDAQNGEPLVYITDAIINTPNLTCDLASDVIMEAVTDKIGRVILSRYGIIVAITTMFALLWRGRRLIRRNV